MNVMYQLLLSLLGFSILASLTFFPPEVTEYFSWRKPVIGLIFSIICVLGILAVFSPNKCLRILNVSKKNRVIGSDLANFVSHGKSDSLAGHHPTCGNFDAHIFFIKGKAVCAACSGLLLGGILALLGAAVYFFGNRPVAENSSSMVLLAIVGVILGLFQFKFSGLIRLSINTLFVIGTLLILIGIDAALNSLFFDMFVVCLILFWLATRIYLSKWDHERICSDCEIENCKIRR
jgi:hypothetical protein